MKNRHLNLWPTCLAIAAATSGTLCGQSVTTGADGHSWTLTTRSFSYQLQVTADSLLQMNHFGRNEPGRPYTWPLGEEITVRGGYSSRTPVLEAVFDGRVRDTELAYDSHRITDNNGYQTLSVTLKDKHYPLSVTEHIRVLPEYDLLEKWTE